MFDIGNVLKQLRFEKKLTQEDVAESIGVSRASYNLWESGHRSPKKQNIMDLARFYDVDPNYLFGYGAPKKQGLKVVQIPLYVDGKTTDKTISLPSELLPIEGNYMAATKAIGQNIQIISILDNKVVMTINYY